MLKNSLNRNQKGDTIIEVMIVLTILGLALSISFATANTSLQNTRQAQENSEATKYAQSQIEALRAVACVNGVDDCTPPLQLGTDAPFCLIPSGITYDARDDVGDECKQGVDNRYKITLERTNAATNTFTATVVWDDIKGVEQNSVTLSYRP